MSAPLIGISTHRQQHETQGTASFGVDTHYVSAVASVGGAPVLIPCGLGTERLRELFHRLDGLLLSGGGDLHPKFYNAEVSAKLVAVDQQRDQCELALAGWAVEEDKPLLAICRGLQVLNVALGGDLVQDIRSAHPQALVHERTDRPPGELAHHVTLSPDSRLASLLGAHAIETNSRHHQAIGEPAPGFQVVARTEDGVVEALEHPHHPHLLAVQWHPEHLLHRPEARTLFESLIQSSRQSKDRSHG